MADRFSMHGEALTTLIHTTAFSRVASTLAGETETVKWFQADEDTGIAGQSHRVNETTVLN